MVYSAEWDWLSLSVESEEEMRRPTLKIEVHDLGIEEEYGVSIFLDEEFAGGSDITDDEELYDKVEGIIRRWLNNEITTVKKRFPKRRR